MSSRLTLRPAAVLKRTAVGGAMTFNHPTVLGTVLYIGNSYGWLLAYTLADVGGLKGPAPRP